MKQKFTAHFKWFISTVWQNRANLPMNCLKNGKIRVYKWPLGLCAKTWLIIFKYFFRDFIFFRTFRHNLFFYQIFSKMFPILYFFFYLFQAKWSYLPIYSFRYAYIFSIYQSNENLIKLLLGALSLMYILPLCGT